jgi:maltooligosyltrehalose trehalohydrolase
VKPPPGLGAHPVPGGTYFEVWAPEACRLEVIRETPGKPERAWALEGDFSGVFRGFIAGIQTGDLYRYRIDGAGPYPDPASRFQPFGVHGPSQVIDPNRFCWTDQGFSNVPLDRLVLYELHVGTFTPEGTFAAARARLPYLQELGVTAVELMPVADFAGSRNWGYDGVALFAPAHCYGTPDELRAFVNEAHRLGLAVHLDVVYNHFGPDGFYGPVYSRHYLSSTRATPWGPAVNLTGEGAVQVRRFFTENALHWIGEYHIDGLRLDATHTLDDGGPRPFLAELAAAVRSGPRPALLIAEDIRNLNRMLLPPGQGGWGLDGVWSDDFHHHLRRGLAGDRHSYFADFSGTAEDIARTVHQGWFFTGQFSRHYGRRRGTDPERISPNQCVIFLQNHDQVGNRVFGERLHHQISLAAWRAASVLLLVAPETPLLFMGQEWAASTPFLFFTDHRPELGRRIFESRMRELARRRPLRDAGSGERIADPQAQATFEASRLDWSETLLPEHGATLALYRKLLALRATEPVFGSADRDTFAVRPLDGFTLLVRRQAPDGAALLAVVRLRGAGLADLRGVPEAVAGEGRRWRLLFTTEDPEFAPDPAPLRLAAGHRILQFARPGAAVFSASLRE